MYFTKLHLTALYGKEYSAVDSAVCSAVDNAVCSAALPGGKKDITLTRQKEPLDSIG